MAASEVKTTGHPVALGKIAYGGVFVFLLPMLLIAWASLTSDAVRLSVIGSPQTGAVLVVLGAALMLTGMWAIYVYGHGLPMNAYPPSRFVVESVYRYLSHPIYIGFSILCFGIAILAESASGFWLVAPLASLGCIVLVEGYERDATVKHFNGARSIPLLRIPSARSTKPTLADRISTFVFAIVPLVLFTVVTNSVADDLGAPFVLANEPAVISSSWPVILYWAGSVFVVVVPLAARTCSQLRQFTLSALVATGLAAIVFIAVPYSQPIPVDSSGAVASYGYPVGSAVAAVALNLAFIFIAARALSDGRIMLAIVVLYGWALVLLVAGFVAGIYNTVDVVLGVAIGTVGTVTRPIWRLFRWLSERIANSWTEWKFGPVRLINHGFYAAAGAFVSLSIIGVLVGAANVPFVLLITFLAITISALSAQWIEGSPRLLRPYGWYGGVAGAFLGALISYLLGANTWLLIAAFCVGAPFVQAAGRLRCLVQGCCHGRPTTDSIGIRYTHPISRVCRIAGLKDIPLHATQLYSIGYNFVVAVVMLRLWFSGTSLSLIVGIYYILTGMGRFVEESFRGEPQTPRHGGLRLYQIFAIVSVIGGIGATMIQGVGDAVRPTFSWDAIIAAALFAVFVCIAFGIDFPASQRRFARLT